jgi:hypothetical protein
MSTEIIVSIISASAVVIAAIIGFVATKTKKSSKGEEKTVSYTQTANGDGNNQLMINK